MVLIASPENEEQSILGPYIIITFGAPYLVDNSVLFVIIWFGDGYGECGGCKA